MRRFAAFAVVTLLASPVMAQVEEHHHKAVGTEQLGTVSFPISCRPQVQRVFNRAVALLHSFWYEEAEKAFRQVAEMDPQCGMAWWGVAMSNYHPVWPSPYSPPELARGKEASEKAVSVGAKTAREKAYIQAIATFYRGPDARAYEAEMEQLHSKFADDDEGAIFYGLILINHGMSLPRDKTYAWQKKAADIFNGLLKKYPQHPGVAHYLIHSFDYPALAPLALDAAKHYAKIAPSAPHALHMPSHIFVRLGMWEDVISSNLASERAATEHASTLHPGAISFDALHADDYLAYAWLQRGEDDKVQKLVRQLAGVKSITAENFAAYYALAAIPARYALERRNWEEAAALTVTPGLAWERYGYAESLTFFARGIGSARTGDAASARKAVSRLQQIRAQLLEDKNAYWADQIDVQIRATEGWIARAERRDDEASRLLQSAAELEEAMDKSPVTPGSILPAREMYGDLLLDLNQPAKALEAYERSLQDSPNRLNSLAGATRAAHLIGDRAKERFYYVKLANL